MLDVIAPPYTPEFVQLFLPLIENEDITGSLRINEEDDPISEFICKCLPVYSSHVKAKIKAMPSYYTTITCYTFVPLYKIIIIFYSVVRQEQNIKHEKQ